MAESKKDDKTTRDNSISMRDPSRRDDGNSVIHSDTFVSEQPKRGHGHHHREKKEMNHFDMLVNKHAQGSEALKQAQLSEHLQNKFKEFYMIRNVISFDEGHGDDTGICRSNQILRCRKIQIYHAS